MIGHPAFSGRRSALLLACAVAAFGGAAARGQTVALTASATYVPSPMTSIPTNQGNVWYVDAVRGNDTNDGKTTATPFLTISSLTNNYGKNHAKLMPGDVIVVRAGTYYDTINMINSGVAQAGPTAPGTPFAGLYTTLMGYPGDPRPVLIGSGTLPNGTIIHGSCKQCSTVTVLGSYIRVSGLDISTPYPMVINGVNQYGNGLYGGQTHHVIFDNNVVHDCGAAGINYNNSDYGIIENNIVYSNDNLSTPAMPSGISIWHSSNYDTLFQNFYHYEIMFNVSYNNQDEALNASGTRTDGNGIILDTNGVAVDGYTNLATNKFLVFGNVSYDNGGRGISVFKTNNADVVNNTTYHNGKDPLVNSEEYNASYGSNIRMYNNIGVGLGVPENYLLDTQYATNVSWEENLFILSAPGDLGTLEFIHDVNAPTPDSTNIMTKDPQFVSVPAGPQPGQTNAQMAAQDALANFHLKSTSPAIQYGVPLGYQIYGLTDQGAASPFTSTQVLNLGAYMY